MSCTRSSAAAATRTISRSLAASTRPVVQHCVRCASSTARPEVSTPARSVGSSFLLPTRAWRRRPPTHPPLHHPHALLPLPPSQALATYNRHRSSAEELVARVPVVEVAADVALCDGGGGATGHPIEYVALNTRDGGATPVACKYCGVRFIRKAGHHGH